MSTDSIIFPSVSHNHDTTAIGLAVWAYAP